MRFYILSLFFILMTPVLALGASIQEPAYRKAEVFRSGLADFGVTLSPDEALCQKMYGKKWRVKCATAPGRYGEIAKGVKTIPPLEGQWQWNDANSLVFLPKDEKSVKPGTKYEIDLSGLFLPESIKLDKKKIAFSTWPFAARLSQSRFMLDPSPESRHRLVLSVRFNYPAPANFRIPAPECVGARIGEPEIVWNAARTELNLSWVANELPAAESIARIVFPGVAEISGDEGELFLTLPTGGASFSATIPARDSIFSVKSIAIEPVLNDGLDQEYEISIETSLYAAPEKLTENLSIAQLPQKNSAEAIEPYNWELSPGISREALKKSKKIKPELLPVSGPRSKFRLRAKPDPGSYIIVAINERLNSSSGLKLNRPFVRIMRVPERDSQLGFLQPGNILPLGATGSLDIYSTNIDRLDWELIRVADPFLALMANGQYIFENGYSQSISDMDAIGERRNGSVKLAYTEDGKAQFSALDLKSALNSDNPSGLMLINLKGYKGDKLASMASRLILATDIGLMAKRAANGAYECFAQTLSGGEPIKGAEIRVLGANGKAVASGITDENGRASLPSLAGLKRESRPVAATAAVDGQIAWLSLEDRARKADYSGFQTGGATSFGEGLTAFIFGERGAYRPGETMNFGAIVKKGDFSPLTDDLPIWTEIIDPRGVAVYSKNLIVSPPGLAEVAWRSPEGALSGKYIFNARAGKDGEIIGSQTARIEDFLPDTLKMRVDLPEHGGWVAANSGEKIRVRLRNLYGTPAANRKVRASVIARPAVFKFKGFEDYIFSDPRPLYAEGAARELPTAITDERGEAVFALPEDFGRLSSVSAQVLAESFEASGGRAATSAAEFLMSPAEKLLGYRPVGSLTNLEFAPKSGDAAIELIAIDSESRKRGWDNLEFSISRKEYATSLISDSMGGYRYDETPVNAPVKSWRADLPENGQTLRLFTDQPGDYILTVKSEGRRVCDIAYSVIGDNPRPPDQAPASAKMRAKSDRLEYRGGDVATVALSLPYAGTGLITLERDGVEAFARFSAEAGDTVKTLKIPDDFEGKGYIVTHFVRSIDSPAAYMNPRVCSVIPIMVNAKKRDMGLRLNVPESIEPGETLKIGVKSAKKGKTIIFAVDEGIHLLTNYKTPDPLEELLGNRALRVETIQGYDLLMPANLSARLSAFGGGADVSPFGAKFRNPFKRKDEPPLIFWSGVVDVGADERFIELSVPAYYNGKIRVIATGASEDGAGSANASATVIAPLVISPAAPLYAAPGDSFEGSIVIENTTSQKKTVKLNCDFDSSLKIDRLPEKEFVIAPNSETRAVFVARVLENPGSVAAKFKAESDGRVYERTLSMSIRPTSYLKTSYKTGRANKKEAIELDREVFPHNAQARLVASPSPLPLIDGFKGYLEAYPHGCSEQLISRAFALLSVRPWFANDKNMEEQLAAAISAIRSRTAGRGVSLWPNSEPDLLLTIYAADFLLSARAVGYGNDMDTLEQLSAIIRDQCVLNDSSLLSARTVAYGVWVLAREGQIVTQLIENLLQSLAQRRMDEWRTDITALFLAAAQKELLMRPSAPLCVAPRPDEGWFDEYSQKALAAYLMTRYFPEENSAQIRRDLYESSVSALNSGGFATFSAAQGVRALAESGGDKTARAVARISCLDRSGGEMTPIAGGKAVEFAIDQCSRFLLEPGDGEAFWQASVTGYDRSPEIAAQDRGISVTRTYYNKNGEIADSFELGDEIGVMIEARTSSGKSADCVIADLLPGGAELIFDRDGQERPTSEKIRNVDRREDRILVYASLDNEPLKFSYKIRAAAKGKYHIPPIRGEAMYDQAVYGQGSGGTLEIH